MGAEDKIRNPTRTKSLGSKEPSIRKSEQIPPTPNSEALETKKKTDTERSRKGRNMSVDHVRMEGNQTIRQIDASD